MGRKKKVAAVVATEGGGKVINPRERAARALEEKAFAGDVAAIKALADGVADRLRTGDNVRGGLLPPHVAAAMIEAGLRAMGETPADVPLPVARVLCSKCGLEIRP